MLRNVNITLPQEILNLTSVNNEEVTSELKELIVLELYREHKISAGKSAEILDISKEAFIHYSSKKGIPHIAQSREELSEDYQNSEKKLNDHNM